MSEAAVAESAVAEAPVGNAPVILTEAAARRVAEIMKTEAPGSVLRVGVDGGGCSGFQYTYTVTTERDPEDVVLEREGATVVVDQISLEYLRGCQIDFIDDLMGRMFKISNPAATASCGCGSSFAV